MPMPRPSSCFGWAIRSVQAGLAQPRELLGRERPLQVVLQRALTELLRKLADVLHALLLEVSSKSMGTSHLLVG